MTPSGPSTFRKNRERRLEGDVAHACFPQVLARTRARGLLSDEPGHPSIDCRGERRSNATHVSTTDPAARPGKKAKGPEVKHVYLGHVRMENRHGRVVDTRVTQATGTAEREAALAMTETMPGQQRVTLGADKHDETRGFVRVRRALRVTPYVA
jgi:hypothetical protein